MMMVFVLLGGLYTSISSMPEWAQWITKFNPVTYFIEVMRHGCFKRQHTCRYQQKYFYCTWLCCCIKYMGNIQLQEAGIIRTYKGGIIN